MHIFSMIRASQQRHAELEKENLELATSLAEKQKEVNRLLGTLISVCVCMYVCMYVCMTIMHYLGMSGSHPALTVNAQREGGMYIYCMYPSKNVLC